MEPGKNSKNSDIPSPENDDTTGVGRLYECTFCKRGFTNAQALGGHMNIHRKDKAKVKQKTQEEHSNKVNEIYTNQQQQLLQQRSNNMVVGRPVSYLNFLPSSNPNFKAGNYLQPVWRQENFGGHVDASSGLRIGIGISPPVAREEDWSFLKENEVDLELRLGHHP